MSADDLPQLRSQTDVTNFAALEEALGSRTILTDQVRQNALLRLAIGAQPYPTAFDTGISAEWSFNMMQLYIIQRPYQLGFTRLPQLKLTSRLPPLTVTVLPVGTVFEFT